MVEFLIRVPGYTANADQSDQLAWRMVLSVYTKTHANNYASGLASVCYTWRRMKSSVKRMLLMKDIDVESKNVHDNRPPLNATANGYFEIVEMLLDHGANIESVNNIKVTSLFATSYSSHLSIVNLLINKGANLEASDIQNWRPLHGAASKGHMDIVRLLIEKGADRNSRISKGQSALGMARRARRTDVAAYLCSLEAVDDGIEVPIVDLEDTDDEDEDENVNVDENVDNEDKEDDEDADNEDEDIAIVENE